MLYLSGEGVIKLIAAASSAIETRSDLLSIVSFCIDLPVNSSTTDNFNFLYGLVMHRRRSASMREFVIQLNLISFVDSFRFRQIAGTSINTCTSKITWRLYHVLTWTWN